MNCKNCNAELKNTMFFSNRELSLDVITLINNELNLNAETYCNSCGDKLYKEAVDKADKKSLTLILDSKEIINKLENKLSKIDNELNKIYKNVPVLTIHNPFGWQYTSLGIVSGQLVTGTGLISEVFSDFTDFFGAKSNSFTQKLTKSESIVINQLKSRAILLGGNAVIATDVDYGEVGGNKGMLMICSAGTAVKLHNLDILEENIRPDILKISTLSEKRKVISEILTETPAMIIERYNSMINDEKINS